MSEGEGETNEEKANSQSHKKQWKRFDRLYRNPQKMKGLKGGESKLDQFQKFLECGFDEAKYVLKLKKSAEMRKSRTDSLKLLTTKQMKDELGYDDATIKKVVAVNEKKGWWRPDKIAPENESLKRYLADVGGSVDATASLTEGIEVAGEMGISEDQATDLLDAGVLQNEGWMGEQGIDDAMDLVPRGTPNDLGQDEKEKIRAEREKAREDKLAKRTPLEVGVDLLEEGIKFLGELGMHKLRCEGVKLAAPTLTELNGAEKQCKKVIDNLKQKTVHKKNGKDDYKGEQKILGDLQSDFTANLLPYVTMYGKKAKAAPKKGVKKAAKTDGQ